MCHSLFKVVIHDIAEGCELVVTLGTVYTVIHRNKVNIMFRKHDLGIHTDLQIITPETRHIFDDNTLDKACLNICNHLLKARAVKGRTGNAIINIEFEVGISVFKSILLQDFFLERDLSRVFFTKTFAVIYEFIFFNFLIKDRQTSVNLNFHVIKENLKRSKLKLV